MTAVAVLHGASALICLAWTLLILAVGRGPGARLLAAAGAAAALWGGTLAAFPGQALGGPPAILEVLRSAVWFAVLLEFCRRMGGPVAQRLARRLAALGLLLTVAGLLCVHPAVQAAITLPGLGSLELLPRMALALLVVLMAENLYRNAPEAARWHVVLPCIALGGLAGFDLLLYLGATVTHSVSSVLLDARAVLTALALPLLALAAVRDRRALREMPLSRDFVFHGTTLMVVGTFLLGLAVVSEALRQLAGPWGEMLRISLVAAALMALLAALSARSVRSRLRRLVADHFFRARYDYRAEWLRCIGTLTLPDSEAAPDARAVRALADAVDSPAGALLLREPGREGLVWVGGWNAHPGHAMGREVPAEILASLKEGSWIAEPGPRELAASRATFPRLWLAVPLLHHREGLVGAVLLDRPRAPFRLDGEAFDLLRMLGREVAMFLAERRSAERLAEQVRIEAYASRFAFVAHDVKTVASQLTFLLDNATTHLQDPEFQRDMLMTVRAAADRINTLIARLRAPADAPAPGAAEPLSRLRALAAQCRHPVEIEHDGTAPGPLLMPAEHFDSAVTHLLNNAIEASPRGRPVRLSLAREEGNLVLSITDAGPGMSAAFVRDVLFRPLLTSKPDGNGIGAWQARELLRRAGGDLDVLTRPGAGTTMRLILPEAAPGRAAPRRLPLPAAPVMAVP
jgi:putative PEP-CTERM system histidine kinase